MKTIKTIDLWSMDYNDAFGLGLFVSAIIDGFDTGGGSNSITG